jgi:hypothetical protein
MTKNKNPYIEELNSNPTTDDPLYDDDEGELTEGMLKVLSKVYLINKIRKLGVEIKKSKTTDKRLELLGSQNTQLGLLMFSMTSLSSSKK